MMYRRLEHVGVSLFIAGMGILNFTYLYQWLQFEMLKKFVLHVVKHFYVT